MKYTILFSSAHETDKRNASKPKIELLPTQCRSNEFLIEGPGL